jgi:amino acid transporter
MNDDAAQLKRMGYEQELHRGMGGFSNFAVSFSIICILAGGITSFHLGFGIVGGAAAGIVWPLTCAVSMVVAVTMAHVASSFPTAGGLYHWASMLGGKGWGWSTGWLNLVGLVAVLTGINVGTYNFLIGSVGPLFNLDMSTWSDGQKVAAQIAGVSVITLTQAAVNHLGIRLTALLIDFSGYLIMVVAALLTLALLFYANGLDFSRLVTFTNYSGGKWDGAVPASTNMVYLIALSMMLPAYTITGFDASAHTSEETVGAASRVPRGIIQSVLVSALAGWVMVCAFVLAMPSVDEAAAQGPNAVVWTMKSVLPGWMAAGFIVGIAVAQYLCGLATVTSASRMMFAFARDGGLPFSTRLRKVSERFKTPAVAIWVSTVLTILFCMYTPVYGTITAASVIFLYLSYTIPTVLGFFAYGKWWKETGPFSLGVWYRPLAVLAAVGCACLVLISVIPPNEVNVITLGGTLVLMAGVWWGAERRRFLGPPKMGEKVD